MTAMTLRHSIIYTDRSFLTRAKLLLRVCIPLDLRLVRDYTNMSRPYLYSGTLFLVHRAECSLGRRSEFSSIQKSEYAGGTSALPSGIGLRIRVEIPDPESSLLR